MAPGISVHLVYALKYLFAHTRDSEMRGLADIKPDIHFLSTLGWFAKILSTCFALTVLEPILKQA